MLIFCSALPGYYVNGTKTLTFVVVRIRVSLSVSVSSAAAVDVSLSLALRQLQCSFQCFQVLFFSFSPSLIYLPFASVFFTISVVFFFYVLFVFFAFSVNISNMYFAATSTAAALT